MTQQVYTRTRAYTHTSLQAHASRTQLCTRNSAHASLPHKSPTQVSHASLHASLHTSLARCSHTQARESLSLTHTSVLHKPLTSLSQVSHKPLTSLSQASRKSLTHVSTHVSTHTSPHTRLHTHTSLAPSVSPHTCRTSPTRLVSMLRICLRLKSLNSVCVFFPRFLPIPQPTLPYLKPTHSQRRPL